MSEAAKISAPSGCFMHSARLVTNCFISPRPGMATSVSTSLLSSSTQVTDWMPAMTGIVLVIFQSLRVLPRTSCMFLVHDLALSRRRRPADNR